MHPRQLPGLSVGLNAAVALLALAAAMLLAACTPSASSPPAADGPRVGDCWNLTQAQFAADSVDTTSVPCGSPHTTETYTVARMTTEPSASGTWTDQQIEKELTRGCTQEALAEWTGLTRDELWMSRIGAASFVPTPAEALAGERWLRCDIQLKDKGKAEVQSASLLDELATSRADTWRGCRTIKAKASAQPDRCRTGAGQWWPVAAPLIGLPDDVWPGQRSVDELADVACFDAVKRVATNAPYNVGSPTRDEWENREKRAICVIREEDFPAAV